MLASNASTDSGVDSIPRAAGDGNGNWVAVWASLENLGGVVGTDRDIFEAHSSDDGVSWSAPAALSANAAFGTGDDTQPEIATDGAGNWFVTWHTNENIGGNMGTDFDIVISRSSNLGTTWSVPVPLNAYGFVDGGSNDQAPHIAMDETSRWIVVWSAFGDFLGTGSDWDVVYTSGVGIDSDGDGLSDGEEVNVYFTNPNATDTDVDGLSDGFEILTSFTNPLNPDSDGDGVSDGAEVSAGTDPNDPNSTPILVPSLAPAGLWLLVAILAITGLALRGKAGSPEELSSPTKRIQSHSGDLA